ncbi:MAG: hypothetical protein OXH93_00230 [Caldilineaceae bacterium]|nr:hypothetical protein [Caldilineaceae bacterium]MDE0460798.1 hypothetical protein [Caldilineaceae bacterium]
MNPHSTNRMMPFLFFALFAALIAPLLPGRHAQAQQPLTATPTATPAPPAIPGNFSGRATNNGVVLSWTAPAGGADNYNIHRTWPRHSKYGTSVIYIALGTSYTDSDVAVSGSYSYQIQAVRDGKASGWGTLTVVVPESVVPTATGTPVPSTATPTATSTPTATLTPTATNVPPGFPTPTPTATPTQTATPTNVPPGFPTPTPTATPEPPAVPGNFSGKLTDNGIVLSWTAPEGGADNYIIYRTWPRSSRDGTYVEYNVPGSATSYTDSDVAVPGGHYRYYIRAFRGRSWWGSPYSDLLTVIVPESATPTATATPTPTPAAGGGGLSGDGAPELTATPTPASALPVPQLTAQAGTGAVELRWTEVSGAVRYELMTWWDAGTGWQPLGGANLTGTSYTHTGVTIGTTYYYTIRAVNAAGETSGWLGAGTNQYPSVTASQGVPAGGTSTATPTPTATAAGLSTPALTAAATEGGVALRWGAVQGAVRYDLMAWWDAETGWQPLGGANLTGTSYTHTAVTAGTTYYYTIRAVNAAGGTSAWLLQYAIAIPPR